MVLIALWVLYAITGGGKHARGVQNERSIAVGSTRMQCVIHKSPDFLLMNLQKCHPERYLGTLIQPFLMQQDEIPHEQASRKTITPSFQADMIPPIATLSTPTSPVQIKEDHDTPPPPLSDSIADSLPQSSGPHYNGNIHDLNKFQCQTLIAALRHAADNHERCAETLKASSIKSYTAAVELREKADALEHVLPDLTE